MKLSLAQASFQSVFEACFLEKIDIKSTLNLSGLAVIYPKHRGSEKGLAGGGWRPIGPKRQPKKVPQNYVPLLLGGEIGKRVQKRGLNLSGRGRISSCRPLCPPTLFFERLLIIDLRMDIFFWISQRGPDCASKWGSASSWKPSVYPKHRRNGAVSGLFPLIALTALQGRKKVYTTTVETLLFFLFRV